MENALEETDDQVVARVERVLRAELWRSFDGTKKRITQMDDGHLANSILMIHRGTDAKGRAVAETVKKKLPLLEDEWRFRHGDKPVVSDRPFQGKDRKKAKRVSGNSTP